ncbi:uncharacterized protein LOC132750900 [Ruditapes philippinarum]|uniref:uncharacterized protein LOC132750900 n=1 Tax=Ruditapes philippinarum TaxID=129788 RepID=UPI00295B8251|nr:uncharacterized protein LOC132750900 [Ruditapes philippinarum]
MDEIDSRRTLWMLSQDEDPWSEKSGKVESPSSDPSTRLPVPGSISPHSLVCSTYADSGFPSLQSSLTSSIDSGHPSSLQTSAVSLDSSFSCFHRSSSFSLSFSEKRAAELSGSNVVSPDEGYDDVDSGQELYAINTLDRTEHHTLDRTEHGNTALTTCVSCSKQSYYDTNDNVEYISGIHSYPRHNIQPAVTIGQIHTWKPAQLAALLKTGLEKYLLIDSRSFLEYNDSHIQQSTNVCCSKLVKRRLQRDKIHIKDFLMQTCHIDIEEFMDVVVYDQCTEDRERLSDDSFLSVLLDKLSSTFKSVALLKGGFLAFQAMYPSLCESKTNNYRCAALTSLSQPCLPVSNVGPTRILPFLYLGSQQDALSEDIVKVNEITYILNVSTTCIKPANISDGHFLRIPVNDNYSAKLTPHFEQAFQFLDKVREANGCCLVHCLAGISRSPTLAIAYIMKHLNMSSDDAYRYIKEKQTQNVFSEFNFLGQLLEFEKHLKQEKGAIDMNNIDNVNKDKGDTRSIDFNNTRNSMTMSCPSISWKQTPLLLSPQTAVSRKKMDFQSTKIQNSQGLSMHGEVCKFVRPDDDSEQRTGKEKFKHENLPLTKSPVKHFFKKDSLKLTQGFWGLSKLRGDFEASETPSPIVNLQPNEYIYSTSFTNTHNAPPLLSPFPCGETTIPVHSTTEDQNYVPYSGNIQRQTTCTTITENSRVVTSDEPKHFQVISSLSESKPMTDPLTCLTSDTPSATEPFSLSGPFLKAGGKRPLRSSLSLSLSPVDETIRDILKFGFKSFNENLEKLSSFPSTSLDKLNFTPCLSSSNENLHSTSTSPRSSGLKRPLNNDIFDMNESTSTLSQGSQGSCNSSALNTSASSVTNNQPVVVVKKREGRAKRPMVRPNSIAFSTYPTFDLGSDCQGSPNSASSSASQDDTSELYAQNGRKSKHSEYMADVRFRLGRYSEREVYRQITAAMEAAMMKSQSFDASRKSRSLDDILSSEDDSSAPNCEFSHFDRVLRRCGLNRDRFASPPLLEKLACVSDISEHYQSNSSLSSTSSHTSVHGSVELIQVS